MGVIAILVVIILVLLLAGALVGLAFELLGLVLTGLIVGGLARLVLPGRQQIGLLTTSLIGIAASLLGGVLGDIVDASWIVRFLTRIGSPRRSTGSTSTTRGRLSTAAVIPTRCRGSSGRSAGFTRSRS